MSKFLEPVPHKKLTLEEFKLGLRSSRYGRYAREKAQKKSEYDQKRGRKGLSAKNPVSNRRGGEVPLIIGNDDAI